MRFAFLVAYLPFLFAYVVADYVAPYRCIEVAENDPNVRWYGMSDMQVVTSTDSRIQAQLTNDYVHHDYTFTTTLQLRNTTEILDNSNTTYVECLSMNGSPRTFKVTLQGAGKRPIKSYWIESNQACKVTGKDNGLDGFNLKDVQSFGVQELKK